MQEADLGAREAMMEELQDLILQQQLRAVGVPFSLPCALQRHSPNPRPLRLGGLPLEHPAA